MTSNNLQYCRIEPSEITTPAMLATCLRRIESLTQKDAAILAYMGGTKREYSRQEVSKIENDKAPAWMQIDYVNGFSTSAGLDPERIWSTMLEERGRSTRKQIEARKKNVAYLLCKGWKSQEAAQVVHAHRPGLFMRLVKP